MAVAGTYKIEGNTPIGRQEGSLTYYTNGNVLTGTASAMGQTLQVLNGRVEGDRFSHDLRVKVFFRTYGYESV